MTSPRSAVRQILRRPGVSSVIVVMLAVGIGATTGIFSLFHQILIRPLPVPSPDELVTLRVEGPRTGGTVCGDGGGCGEYAFSYPVYRALEARQTVFTDVAAYHGGFAANLAHGGQATSGTGLFVSGSYFDVLRLEPALGRLIAPQDEPRVGESRVAVLSHAFWQSRFGGADDVVGRKLTVNDEPLTIVGVAPRGFAGTSVGSRPDVFVPLTLRWAIQSNFRQPEGGGPDDRFTHFATLFARLAPGLSMEQAQTTLNAMYAPILEQEIPLNRELSPEEIRQRRLVLEPGARGQSRFPETAARPLALLLAITGLVLLVVCANIANLLLAHGASRTGEMAIRTSLGATRARLVAQLLAELAVLAAVGIALCLPVASATLGLIAAILPEQLAGVLAPRLHAEAVAGAAAVSVGTVALFGLMPALRVTRADAVAAMKAATAQVAGGRGSARMRGVLMTVQIAFSMVLLVLAGLFALSLSNIARVDLGMNVDSVVHFRVDPRLSGYGPEQRGALRERLTAEIAAQPGVTSVASARDGLIDGFNDVVSIAGFEDTPAGERLARSNAVSPAFFDVLSIPLLAGRAFTEQDRGARVAIVNESFVRKFGLGAGTAAIGERFGAGLFVPGEETVRIVGVVADVRNSSLKEDAEPQFFLPYRAEAETFVSWLNFYVGSGMPADALMRTIPRAVSRVAPTLPVSDLSAARRVIADDVYVDRMIAVLSGGFASLATLLAGVGLYGFIAFSVTQRTRELGLRLALGAGPARLRGLVLGPVGVIVLVGGGIGIAVALGLGRVVESMLFGVTGAGPLVLAAAVSVLGLVAFAAAYWPARRASRIEPMDALRYE